MKKLVTIKELEEAVRNIDNSTISGYAAYIAACDAEFIARLIETVKRQWEVIEFYAALETGAFNSSDIDHDFYNYVEHGDGTYDFNWTGGKRARELLREMNDE